MAPSDDGCAFTTGEYFPDGVAVEPVRDESGAIVLLCCDGERTHIAPQVEVRGRVYQPAALDQTFARALRIPRGTAPFGTAKQLVQGISRVVAEYTRLTENFVTAVTRFVLATWVVSQFAGGAVVVDTGPGYGCRQHFDSPSALFLPSGLVAGRCTGPRFPTVGLGPNPYPRASSPGSRS